MILDAGDVMLRPSEDRDHAVFLAMLTDPHLMKFALDERVLPEAEAEQFIHEHFSTLEPLGFRTVALKSSDEAIGFAGFRECLYLDAEDIEFGWVIATGCHGRGYATAIGERLIAYALESLQLPRILAACHPLNSASEHILRDKLNMHFERQVEPRPDFHRRVYKATAGWDRRR